MSDTVSQLPPVRENFPDPILRRISSGVSFGPLANGVYLKQEKGKKSKRLYKKTHVEICVGSLSYSYEWTKSHPASMVYSRTPKLQMSQAAS